MPRRAAFWVLFQFQTGVSALLADLNRRCLTTLGHGGHSSSPYGVGVSSHMKFTFPVIIRSVASICPKVLDFLEVRSDQASSHLAKYVESSSITFSIPSIEIFGSRKFISLYTPLSTCYVVASMTIAVSIATSVKVAPYLLHTLCTAKSASWRTLLPRPCLFSYEALRRTPGKVARITIASESVDASHSLA